MASATPGQVILQQIYQKIAMLLSPWQNKTARNELEQIDRQQINGRHLLHLLPVNPSIALGLHAAHCAILA